MKNFEFQVRCHIGQTEISYTYTSDEIGMMSQERQKFWHLLVGQHPTTHNKTQLLSGDGAREIIDQDGESALLPLRLLEIVRHELYEYDLQMHKLDPDCWRITSDKDIQVVVSLLL